MVNCFVWDDIKHKDYFTDQVLISAAAELIFLT